VLVGCQPIGRHCSWWPTGAAPASLIPVVVVVFICGLSDVLINEYLFIYYYQLLPVFVFRLHDLLRLMILIAWGASQSGCHAAALCKKTAERIMPGLSGDSLGDPRHIVFDPPNAIGKEWGQLLLIVKYRNSARIRCGLCRITLAFCFQRLLLNSLLSVHYSGCGSAVMTN